MNYWSAVNITLKYIEKHLKDIITLSELSGNAGYSEYHFSRIFKSETGMSVMDYVRRRRLVHALANMDSSRTMTDIAIEYGFDTQGGFIKAFHKVYGSTPGNYRMQVLGRLPNNIQFVSIEQRKEESEMHINAIENDLIFKKVMNVADVMFNITAQGGSKYGYDFWQNQFMQHPELMIYAEDSGKICGFAYGWAENNTDITVAFVGVVKEYQGQGIGRALLTEMEDRSKALGYGRLTLGSAAGEEGFYEKCGYTGNLLIQTEENTIEELRSLNPGYKEVWSGVYEGHVNQLYLEIPMVNRELQKKYEETFPACNTIMVFGKSV
jgi:AraC-like DNA-binding protein/ribosomal protein S18 acetylase RimI-like enzyme